MGHHRGAIVDQSLDRIGDLQLATGARCDLADGVEDPRGEKVDTDQGEVGGRGGRLLDQPYHPTALELGHPESLRFRHPGEQDHRVRRLAAEFVDQRGDAVADQVVTEIHDEAVVSQPFPGGEHRVSKAERRFLGDIGHTRPEV